MTTANTDLAATQATLRDTAAQLEAATAEMTQVKADLAAANDQLTATAATLSATQEELAATKAALESATAELTATAAALAATQEELAATKSTLEATQTTLDAANAALESTQAELSSTQGTLASAHSTMTELLGQSAISAGFKSNVTVTAILNRQGSIAYLTVDASGETEGLGAKVMDTEYLVQFLGKQLPLTLGEDVDAIAGATITSQAVVDALNLLAPDYDNARDARSIVNQRSVQQARVYVQNVKGHDSNVKVVVYITPEGKITSVRVDATGEQNGQGVMEADFTNQFLGRSTEMTLGVDVDAVAGATATSEAVVEAINNLID